MCVGVGLATSDGDDAGQLLRDGATVGGGGGERRRRRRADVEPFQTLRRFQVGPRSQESGGGSARRRPDDRRRCRRAAGARAPRGRRVSLRPGQASGRLPLRPREADLARVPV